MNLQQLKSEFQRNKAKSLVLGGLVLVLIGFGVKAVFELRPRHAAASAPTSEQPAVSIPAMQSGEIDQKVKQADALWQVMRTKRGIVPAAAFRFRPEGTEYTMLVQPRPRNTDTQPAETPVAVAPKYPTPEEIAREQERLIREQADTLVLHAVLMGDTPTVLMSARKADSKPARYGFNDEIEGFQILKIQERSVLVAKKGISVEISLPDASGKNTSKSK